MTSLARTNDAFRHAPGQALQLVNSIAALLERNGLPSFVDLSERSLLATAQRKTGLTDWGTESFLEGLRVLLNTAQSEGHLNFVGRINLRQDILRMLVNQLRIQDTLKRTPEILETPVHRPIFILGYPRTGTTLLHNLLSQDTDARVPLLWELLRPAPPPKPQSRQADPRIGQAEWLVRMFYLLSPDMRTIHEMNATEPEECIFLFPDTLTYNMRAVIPSYTKWYTQHSHLLAYQYYRQQLQILQWNFPNKHWVLKSPFHLWSLDALLAVFPDACIIQLHRDPKKVIPSWCSMVEHIYHLAVNHVDPHYIGQDWLAIWGEAMDRAMKVRETADAERFYDIHFDTLVRNPVKTVQDIYAHFGLEYSANLEGSLTSWLTEHPQNKRGAHHYSLEQFGLDPKAVDQRFAQYIDHFGIKTE